MATHDAKNKGFTDTEREAMKARTKELAAEQRDNRKRADGEKDVLAAIEAMSGTDKSMAETIHKLVTDAAPSLWPKTWYGMPAYAKDGKVVCFFQAAKKFEARYASFGFNDAAKLDQGSMWATSFALIAIGPAEEKIITDLVKKALS